MRLYSPSLYVIQHPYTGHVKVGRATIPYKNLSVYNRGCPHKLFRYTKVYKLADPKTLKHYDGLIQKALKHRRVEPRTEWLNATLEEVISFCDHTIPHVGGLNAANDNELAQASVA